MQAKPTNLANLDNATMPSTLKFRHFSGHLFQPT